MLEDDEDISLDKNLTDKDKDELIHLLYGIVDSADKIMRHFLSEEERGAIKMQETAKFYISRWYKQVEKYNAVTERKTDRPTIH